MADPVVVFHPPPHVSGKSYSTPSGKKSVTESNGPETCSNRTRKAKVGGLDGFRKTLATEGLSEQATSLITSSRRKGSISSYELAC